MSKVSDALNTNPNFGIYAAKNKSLERATKVINGDNKHKYLDLSSLQESGKADLYYRINISLVKIECCQIPTNNAKTKLNEEHFLLDNIQGLIAEANAADGQNAEVVGSRAERADKALKELEKILNTRDTTGQYMLGGIHSNEKPCRDLVAASNIVNGVGTANYTDARANKQAIAVSDRHSVECGLSANHPAFVKCVEFLNHLKNGHLNEAQAAYVTANKSLDKLQLENGENLKTVTDAEDYNATSKIELYTRLEEDFSVSVVEANQNIKDAMEALQILMIIMMKGNQLDKDLNRILE